MLTDTAAGLEITPVAAGAYVPHIIVMLTDGVATTGPHPLTAAQQAADRGVRVYTIGFGTEAGSSNFGGRNFGGRNGQGQPGGQGAGGPGGGFRRGIDETTLAQIAGMTGGKYYAASSASELQSVFAHLPTSVITRRETTEISVVFVVAGALLLVTALGLALLWQPLP